MHDSLGRRLSLVSVRAAALQVSELPAAQRQAVGELADCARDAVTELYQLIGSLRGATNDNPDESPGIDHVGAVVEDFRTAGVEVTVDEQGDRSRLPTAADRAAYRVVEEGLTNAAKHGAGRSVAVRMTWETDALVLTVSNPVTADGASPGGFGLAGLRERVQAAGGFLDHRLHPDGEFRLVAMLPVAEPDTSPQPRPSRFRTAVGLATAGVLFVLLPASLLTGVS